MGCTSSNDVMPFSKQRRLYQKNIAIVLDSAIMINYQNNFNHKQSNTVVTYFSSIIDFFKSIKYTHWSHVITNETIERLLKQSQYQLNHCNFYIYSQNNSIRYSENIILRHQFNNLSTLQYHLYSKCVQQNHIHNQSKNTPILSLIKDKNNQLFHFLENHKIQFKNCLSLLDLSQNDYQYPCQIIITDFYYLQSVKSFTKGTSIKIIIYDKPQHQKFLQSPNILLTTDKLDLLLKALKKQNSYISIDKYFQSPVFFFISSQSKRYAKICEKMAERHIQIILFCQLCQIQEFINIKSRLLLMIEKKDIEQFEKLVKSTKIEHKFHIVLIEQKFNFQSQSINQIAYQLKCHIKQASSLCAQEIQIIKANHKCYRQAQLIIPFQQKQRNYSMYEQRKQNKIINKNSQNDQKRQLEML